LFREITLFISGVSQGAKLGAGCLLPVCPAEKYLFFTIESKNFLIWISEKRDLFRFSVKIRWLRYIICCYIVHSHNRFFKYHECDLFYLALSYFFFKAFVNAISGYIYFIIVIIRQQKKKIILAITKHEHPSVGSNDVKFI
jgi:hypothetical protein